MKSKRPDGARRGGSTAAVLWLMILLVFLPIAAGHVVARHLYLEPPKPQQAALAG